VGNLIPACGFGNAAEKCVDERVDVMPSPLIPPSEILLLSQGPDPEPFCGGIPGIIKPGGNIGICMPLGKFAKLKLYPEI
jgi:hypothetical protein